jgi:hypothetical protein
MLVADSSVYDRKTILAISKAILTKAMPSASGGTEGGSGIARSLMIGVVMLHRIKSSRNSTPAYDLTRLGRT